MDIAVVDDGGKAEESAKREPRGLRLGVFGSNPSGESSNSDELGTFDGSQDSKSAVDFDRVLTGDMRQ